MRRLLVLVFAVSLLSGLSASGVLCQIPGVTIAITVSPNVVNTTANGQWVTVHTDMPASQVQSLTATLDGVAVAVDWTKVDAQGNIVAKLCLDTVLAVIQPPSAQLTLSGVKTDGESFSGSDTIKVIKVGDKR